MPRPMGPGSRIAANATENSSPFLTLFEVLVSATERLFLVNNEEPVVHKGQVYRPFPVAFEQLEEGMQWDLPGIAITASNISLEMQALLEHRNGLLDRKVILRVVHIDHPEEDALESLYTIDSSSSTQEAVTFRLSQLPFMEIDLPYQRFTRLRCRFDYKGKRCGWGFPTLPGGVVDMPTCSKMLEGPNGCRAHGDAYEAAGVPRLHPARHGGFIAIPRRIV